MENDNPIIMSNKVEKRCKECNRGGLESFIASVVYRFEMKNEIVISSREGYMSAVDRIVSLFKNIGIEEIERKYNEVELKGEKIRVIAVRLRNNFRE